MCRHRWYERSTDIQRADCRLATLLLCALLLGCVQQMARQPRLGPLEESDFFADGQGSRHLVMGVVPRGQTRTEVVQVSRHFLTGLTDGQPARELPPEVLDSRDLGQLLVRGQERYQIFCSHCHDSVGTGAGIVPQRGYPEAATFHSQRLRQAPLGYFFQVITTGRGRMPPHGKQIPPDDRWAIVAYIRALQLSQHTSVDWLAEQDYQALEEAGALQEAGL